MAAARKQNAAETIKKQQAETATTKKQPPENVADDVVTDIVKQKRKRPDLTEMFTPQCQPGEISRMMSNTMTVANWPDIDTDDPDQVINRIAQYQQFCIDNDVKPDLSGMALALGVTRKTLWCWENGVDSNKPQSVRNALKKGRAINENILVTMMQNGKINPIPALFLLKNNHDYRDQQDLVITPNTPFQNGEQRDVDNVVQALPE